MATPRFLVGLFCVALLVAIDRASSKSIKKRFALSNAHEQLRNEYDCRHIANKTECQFVMGNALLMESHRILRRTTQDRIEESATTNKLEPECPNYKGNYLLQDNLPEGLRSLSPYELTIDHNPNRIPSFISQARCLCKGCISPKTLKETRTLDSAAISVTIDVYKRNTANRWIRSKEEVTVGCTCVIPSRVTG